MGKKKLLEIKNAPFVQIKKVCKVEKGKTPIQKAIPGIYPLVVTTDERKTSDNYQFDCKAACLSLVSARGHGVAQVSRIFYQEGKFALGNILCAIIPNLKLSHPARRKEFRRKLRSGKNNTNIIVTCCFRLKILLTSKLV